MPIGGRNHPGTMLEDMINKDHRDWLDMASTDRPQSAGNVLDRSKKDNKSKNDKSGRLQHNCMEENIVGWSKYSLFQKKNSR